jgi:hypothetical protein
MRRWGAEVNHLAGRKDLVVFLHGAAAEHRTYSTTAMGDLCRLIR